MSTQEITVDDVNEFFAGYGQISSDQGHDDGFISFAWDMRKETLTALCDGDDERLTDDIAYALRQVEEYRSADTEAAARAYIEGYRADLIEALTESLREEIGEQLRRLRKEAGLSQGDVAERAGLAQGRLSEYESGERSPTADMLQRLAGVLGPIVIGG